MSVTVEDLILRIKAEGTQTLTQLNRSVKEAKDNLNGAIEVFGKSSKEADIFAQRLKNAQDKVQNFRDNVKTMGNSTKLSSAQLLEFGENVTIVATGLFNLAKGIANVTIESIKNGATLKVLRENYKGTTEDLELLKKATAGTLTEEQLIPIFNKATEQMKLTTNETARLLAYSEDLADKGIGTLTENFGSLTTAILTGGRGLRTLGIDQKQFKEDLKNTATQLGINTGLIQDGNEEDSISIEKLDAKTQRVLILKTLFDGGYIPSLENVISKEQDSADKLEAVQVKLKEAKTEAGLFILNGIEPLVDSFLGFGKAGNVVTGTIAGISSGVFSLIPLVGSLRMAFMGLGSTAVLSSIAGAGKGILALLSPIAIVVAGIAVLVNALTRIQNLANGRGFVSDPMGDLSDDDTARQKAIDSLSKQRKIDTKMGKITEKYLPGNINEEDIQLRIYELRNKKEMDLDKLKYKSEQEMIKARNEALDLTKGANIGKGGNNNSPKKDVEEIKEIVQAVDEIELLKEQIFNKISRGGLGAKVIGTGGTIPTNNEDVKKILAIQYEEEYKLWEANYEKQQGKTRALYDAGISFANEFTNILNFGADSFGAKFLSYLNQAFNVASSVARILSLVAPTGGFGGILGGIIKFFGFAQGGSVPGVGDSDTVPAMLTPGEVVIRKSAVNKYGADFFNSFNGGSNSINTLGRYANGGIVSGGGGLQIEIIGNAKLTGKGSELRAVLSKENIRVKQSRSKR